MAQRGMFDNTASLEHGTVARVMSLGYRTATPRKESLIGEQSARTYRSTEAFRRLQYHGTLSLVGEPQDLPWIARDTPTKKRQKWMVGKS